MQNRINRYLILAFLLISSFRLSALNIGVTGNFFQYKNTKYLEVYLKAFGNSVKFVKVDSSGLQASIEFLIIIKNKDNIVNYDKFNLDSPVFEEIKDFASLRRFKIDNGEYTIEIKATDRNDSTNVFTITEKIKIDLDNEKLCTSSLELLAELHKDKDASNPLVKNGYYMEPAIFNFFPKTCNDLGLYFEIYNADKYPEAEKAIISLRKGLKNENLSAKSILRRQLKLKSLNLIPVVMQFDIRALPSGNYHIQVEILDRSGNVLYVRKADFQRSNPVENEFAGVVDNIKNSFAYKMPADSVFYSLKAMVPIVKASESTAINDIITKKDIKKARFFLWRYWNEYNKANPYFAYSQYMKYAKAVDIKFRSQVGYGFETDRGYIYLKYGRPTEVITVENEPTAPPYEIWYYDVIEDTKQKNVKFIFYIPSLATNDYVLLHSNCLGERQNPAWFYYLYSKRHDSNIKNMKNDQIKQFFNELKNSFGNNAVKIWEDL